MSTDDETLDDIAAAEAVGDPDPVLLGRPDVLSADHTGELLAGGEGDPVDDGDGDDGLERGEAGDGAEDERVWGGRMWSLAEGDEGVAGEGTREAGAPLAVLEVDAARDVGQRAGDRLAWEEERHK